VLRRLADSHPKAGPAGFLASPTYHEKSLPQVLHHEQPVHPGRVTGFKQAQRVPDEHFRGAQVDVKHLLHAARQARCLVEAQGEGLVDLVHVHGTETSVEELHGGWQPLASL